MTELAVDGEMRYRMGMCSIRNVKKYDNAEFIRQYEMLYMKYS